MATFIGGLRGTAAEHVTHMNRELKTVENDIKWAEEALEAGQRRDAMRLLRLGRFNLGQAVAHAFETGGALNIDATFAGYNKRLSAVEAKLDRLLGL